MTDTQIAAHIDKHDLESALWHDLVHADYGESEFVGIAREINEPRGLILATERLDPFLRVPVGVIRWLYVESKHRNQGIGRALLEAAEQWMDHRGIRVRETSLAEANEEAAALYVRRGYVRSESRWVAARR